MQGNSGRIQRLVGKAWDQAKSPLYRNAFFIMVAPIIGAGLGFFFVAIVARFYAESDLGYATTLFATISFVAGLAHLGLGTALVRFLPETEEKILVVNTCLTVAGLLAIGLSFLFMVGLGIWAPRLDFVLQNPIYLVAIVATTFLIAIASLLDSTGIALRRADVLTWRTATYSVLKVPLAAAFAAIAITSGRLGVFIAIAIPFCVSVIVEAFVLVPRVLPGYRPWPTLHFHRLRPMLRFSLGNYTANSIGAAGRASSNS